MEMVLLGDSLSAEEALRIGLVNEVVEPDQVMVRAEAMARQLAESSPIALQKAKEAMVRAQSTLIAHPVALRRFHPLLLLRRSCLIVLRRLPVSPTPRSTP